MNTFITISTIAGAVLIIALIMFAINFLVVYVIDIAFEINDQDTMTLIILVTGNIVCAIAIVVILCITGTVVFK